MAVIFQLVLFALVFWSFVMIIGVPIAYASPSNWDQSKRLIFFGSIVWFAMVAVVAVLNPLVV